ncbi:MAG: PD-(D/E)XK nuclease family protein, partial [Lachnospiraceae bacterium]|jgi:ATP-dependent helicase/nuclease subunit A|nr:PD-(D/E)XK nuclease family protein [Lachnospiraceae bacterium]
VRLANLEMLMKKAAAFAKTSYYGLFHFVRYIEKLEKYEVDYGEANVLGEDADVVRLLSIHKSKGLEFPVCFVAGLGKKFNFRDSYGALSLDAGLGLGVEHIDPKRRVRRKTLSQNVVSQKLKLESLGEELRILYVAMTRAKEKLILTGAVRKMPTPRPDMSFLRLAKAGSFLDFVLPPVLDTAAADLFALRTVTVSDLDIGTAQAMVKQSDRYEALREALHTHMSSPQEGLYSYQEKVTAMSEKFAKPYSSANLAKLYAKTTVSELKKAASIVRASDEDETADVFNKALFEEPEIIPYIPGFVGKEAVAAGSGAVRGLAYHRLLEIIRFGELQTPGMAGVDLAGVDLAAQLAAQIDDHISQGRLLPEERDNINLDRIIALFSSPIAIRMIAADRLGQLRKEQPFVIGISADRLDPGFPAEEAILIQGIIDAFFAEEDGLVIVDYKTDAVENGSELVKRYQKQLDYYQEALEQLTGKRVKEKVIYSFALGEVVAMP